MKVPVQDQDVASPLTKRACANKAKRIVHVPETQSIEFRTIRCGENITRFPMSFSSAEKREVVDFLQVSEILYPYIGKWFERKVVPELGAGRRTCLMVRQKDRLVALAIAKFGKKAKLCSLRVEPDVSRQGWGDCLLNIVEKEARERNYGELFFTISEETAADCVSFFRERGYFCRGGKKGVYRPKAYEFFMGKKLLSGE